MTSSLRYMYYEKLCVFSDMKYLLKNLWYEAVNMFTR